MSAIHLLLERFRDSLPLVYQDRIFVIPNGVKTDSIAPVFGRLPRIISVGRLEPQKRHDRLIRAFHQLKGKFPEWEVHIFGEGSERQNLSNQIDELGLVGRVFLRGISEEIEKELNSASIFVIASEFEGFGIVVLEAQRAGIPCVAYDNCNGPNELITDGRDGLLIPTDNTSDTLSDALEMLIRTPRLREAMGEAGRQNVRRYGLTGIIGKWEAMIEAVIRAESAQVVS